MAVGEKYKSLLKIKKKMFFDYAEKSESTVEVIDNLIDQSKNAYSVLDQKLLIPAKYTKYENIAFIDLDMLISNHAPSIFNYCEDAPFKAVVTNISSEKYIKTCSRYFKINPLNDHSTYFHMRGFNHINQSFSINGGVWTCKPNIVGEYLRDAYYSKTKSLYANEPCSDELFLALHTQYRNHFASLDERFNKQLLFDIYGDDENYKNIGQSFNFKLLKYFELNFPFIYNRYPIAYINIINKALMSNWFVHFAGKLPYLRFRS